MRNPSISVAAAATAMVAVGSGVTVSDGLAGYPVFSAQAMRYALAATALVVGLRATGRTIPIPRGRDWIWLVLIAATGQGLFNVATVRGVTFGEPAAMGLGWATIALIAEGTQAFPTPRSTNLQAIVYLAIVVTSVAFTLWYLAVQRLEPSTAGLFAGLVAVAAAISGLARGLTTINPRLGA